MTTATTLDSVLHADRLARVALSAVTDPGDTTTAGFVARFGVRGTVEHLRDDRAVFADVAARLATFDAERVLEEAAQRGIRFVIPTDDEWPTQLADLAGVTLGTLGGGVPLGLWVRGESLADNAARSVAVVGSRACTTYGADVAADLSCAVAQAGVPVVSGLAFGIDQAAHRGALAGRGATVAVMACGLDRCYPSAHGSLMERIATDGGTLVSELAPGAAPTRVRFLARNRLIAALSGGTVVVEASFRSGALNAAYWARAIGRPLMAVPGEITSLASQGANDLLATGDARLVTSGGDVLNHLP